MEQLREGGAPGAARPAAFPSSLRPGRPSWGLGGHPLGRPRLRRPRPALGPPRAARPARLRGGTGWASSQGRATSGVAAATLLRAPNPRPPLAPQAAAMKIKDAKKPCKMGAWARWVGRAPGARPEAPGPSGLVLSPRPVPRAGWGGGTLSMRWRRPSPSPCPCGEPPAAPGPRLPLPPPGLRGVGGNF